VFVLAFGLSSVGQAFAEASTPAYIDESIFASTVPQLMVLGGGYTVQVNVFNNSTKLVQGAVELVYPQQFFYSDDPTQFLAIAPGDNLLLKFDLVAANPHVGPMNVSALLFVNETHGLALASTASTTVFSVQRSQTVVDILYYGLFALLAAGGVYTVFVISRRKTGEREIPS